MKTILMLGAASALILAPTTQAEEAKTASNLKITAEAGVLITTGNTESSSYLGKLTARQKLEQWKNKYTLDLLMKEAEVLDANGNKATQETDNRWSATAKGNYTITDKSSAFLFGSYTADEYGAFATYTTVSGGYSYSALANDEMTLDLEAGVGFVSAEKQSRDSEDSALYRGAADFEWKINDMTQFTQTLSVEHAPDLDNTRTISETGVSASFNSSMQMKFGYKIISNSEVDPGFEKTDTETSVTLVVKF